jgi:hypothetical protein
MWAVPTSAMNIRIEEVNVRFKVFSGVTMKNAVFWNIKTQFVQETH